MKNKKLMVLILAALLLVLDGYLSTALTWADIFNIYNDAGIADTSILWTWSGGSGAFTTIPDQEAPERISYFRTISQNWAGWGVVFVTGAGVDYTLDFSNYNGGDLKFFVKTPVNLKVQIQLDNRNGTDYSKYISNYGWNGQNVWQEITIPISAFGADLTRIFSPFKITAETSATFYVDYVRWTVPITGTPTAVAVNGRQLLVNGSVFTVKGVAGDFTPIGEIISGYDWSLFPKIYTPSITLTKNMGANVIRTYMQRPTQKAALDSLQQQGIYVIMGFPVDAICNGQPVDFSNLTVRANIKARFLDMIKHWKYHPAILMWCLGNEVNRDLENAGVNPSFWYSLVEECSVAAHLEDPNHPVTTANADQTNWDIGNAAKNADDASLSHLDLWSLQLYRGMNFSDAFTAYASKSSKPLLISEFGCDAYDGRSGHQHEDQAMQANYLGSQWDAIGANLSSSNPSQVCIGGVVFSLRDGWYKHNGGSPQVHDTVTDWTNGAYLDPNMNEEWWGIISLLTYSPGIAPRQAYQTLQNKFQCGSQYYAGPSNAKSCDGTSACCSDPNMYAKNGACVSSCSPDPGGTGSGGGCGCFISGTPILLADGTLKPIEKIKVGDAVLAFDEKTNGFKKDKVSEFFKHSENAYLIINGHLKVTGNHPVYSRGKWIEIGKLKIGDRLLNSQGELEVITSIKQVKKRVKVYNLEVNPYHTYIAGGIVAHNKLRPSCPPLAK